MRLMLAVLLSLVALAPSMAAGDAHADPASARGVHALVAGESPAVEGFVDAKVGSCSAPTDFGLGFGAACARHDEGYDLLRHADGDHRPLGAWARRAVDRRLLTDMRSRCAEHAAVVRPGCAVVARVFYGVVRANSVRQHDGPPRREPVVQWLAAAAAAALAGLVLRVRNPA